MRNHAPAIGEPWTKRERDENQFLALTDWALALEGYPVMVRHPAKFRLGITNLGLTLETLFEGVDLTLARQSITNDALS